jgi:hypothetical protein
MTPLADLPLYLLKLLISELRAVLSSTSPHHSLAVALSILFVAAAGCAATWVAGPDAGLKTPTGRVAMAQAYQQLFGAANIPAPPGLVLAEERAKLGGGRTPNIRERQAARAALRRSLEGVPVPGGAWPTEERIMAQEQRQADLIARGHTLVDSKGNPHH